MRAVAVRLRTGSIWARPSRAITRVRAPRLCLPASRLSGPGGSCSMGGKNKKHKAPGAGAVRAAVSAARAKATAESGAAGEAPGKKPVPRPLPVTASTKEPRVRQGPKIYSFNSATDSGAPSNLDKSILKVVINSKLEQRIIGVINEHKKQNNDKGMISGRLTAKKLQDLYMALQAFSFKTKDIEEAMTNTVLYGGDLHSALDWLCLNLPDGKQSGFEYLWLLSIFCLSHEIYNKLSIGIERLMPLKGSPSYFFMDRNFPAFSLFIYVVNVIMNYFTFRCFNKISFNNNM